MEMKKKKKNEKKEGNHKGQQKEMGSSDIGLERRRRLDPVGLIWAGLALSRLK